MLAILCVLIRARNVLIRYVPELHKSEHVPCHHIPLDSDSRTLATLNVGEAEEALKLWLHQEIDRIEGERVLSDRLGEHRAL